MKTRKSKMKKTRFNDIRLNISEDINELKKTLASIDSWYEDLIEMYDDSNWDMEESRRYHELDDSLDELKSTIAKTSQCAMSYQAYIIELVHKFENDMEKSKGGKMKTQKAEIKKTDNYTYTVSDLTGYVEDDIDSTTLGDMIAHGLLQGSVEDFDGAGDLSEWEFKIKVYKELNKSKSPSVSKTYKIKGHEGTFKAIAKANEFTLMQSVELGQKAYNVILKGNKIYADGVNGLNDRRWRELKKTME